MANIETLAADTRYFAEVAAPSTPSAGQAVIYVKSDGKIYLKDDAGTETDLTASGGSSSLLAVKAYRAGSDAALASTSNTTSTDVDATNAAVTFTAPASGNVLIRFTGMVSVTGTSQVGYWTVRETTTVLATSLVDQTSTALAASRTVAFYLTGVTAGSHTYKWGQHTTASDTISLFTGPTFGQLVMEVWSAP